MGSSLIICMRCQTRTSIRVVAYVWELSFGALCVTNYILSLTCHLMIFCLWQMVINWAEMSLLEGQREKLPMPLLQYQGQCQLAALSPQAGFYGERNVCHHEEITSHTSSSQIIWHLSGIYSSVPMYVVSFQVSILVSSRLSIEPCPK